MERILAVAEERLAEFRRHCLTHRDAECRAWWFTDGPPSPSVVGHQMFGGANTPFRLYLLDLYHGRTPTLYNLTTFTSGPAVTIGLHQLVILDSNVVSYLNRYMRGRLRDPRAQRTVEEFLRFIVTADLDPNPIFYLSESQVKATPARWRAYASDFMETVIALQIMDKDLLVAEGRLASSIAAHAEHLCVHDATEADRLVSQYVESVPAAIAQGEAEKLDLHYAALMKAALLRLESSQDIPEKLDHLGEFMASRLGAVLGMERFLAILHWAAPERFARLMTPLQPGANPTAALEKLRSTTWDIYLARLPEQLGRFISRTGPGDAEAICDLYFVATGEDQLAEFIGHRSIELLVQHADPSKSTILVGHRPGVLMELLGETAVIALKERSNLWEEGIVKTAHERRPLKGQALQALIAELEAEIQEACRSGR